MGGSMFCTACAARNPDASRRCQRCGTGLERNAAVGDGEARSRRGAGDNAGNGTPEGRHRLAPVIVLVPVVVMAVVVAGFHRAEQNQRADWFDRAVAAAAAGDYAGALDAYAAAAGYRDADQRRADLVASLGPVEAAYREGVDALGAGRYDEAIAVLLPIVRRYPAYGDAAELLAEARRLRTFALLRRASASSARRDWLDAERALAALVAADPGDGVLAERLAGLRRHHAPFVLARGGALWLVGPDGADERLLTSAVPVARPIWSPDRRRIAFVSGDPDDGGAPSALYVIDADGSGLRRLNRAVHPNAVPVWSPDGGQIAYTSVESWNLRRDQGLLTVHIVDVASGIDVDVTSRTERHAITPTWSPDGGRLAFISREPPETLAEPATGGPGEIYVLDVASGEIADLTAGRVPEVIRVLWSPDDEQLLLYSRTWEGNAGTTSAGAHLFALDALDQRLTVLAEGIAATAAGWSPAWAPGGGGLAYVDGASTVVIRGADDEAMRVETGVYLTGALTWSPDGTALLAVSADPGAPSVLIALDEERPALSELSIAYDTEWPTGTPQWSPPAPATPPTAPTIAGTAFDNAADDR